MKRLRCHVSSSLSVSAVTWHSPFLLLIYRIRLTRLVTQIGILWQWPPGLNAVFTKQCLIPLLFHPPPPPLFSLLGPLCQSPKPAKHTSKWHLLRPSSKKPWAVGFPCLMWHLWWSNRVEGGRWGPSGTMVVCLGDGRQGVKNQNVEDISSQQIDTGPLIPGFSFLSSWTWSALQMAALLLWPFLESKKDWRGEVWAEGIRGSHNTQTLYTP